MRKEIPEQFYSLRILYQLIESCYWVIWSKRVLIDISVLTLMKIPCLKIIKMFICVRPTGNQIMGIGHFAKIAIFEVKFFFRNNVCSSSMIDGITKFEPQFLPFHSWRTCLSLYLSNHPSSVYLWTKAFPILLHSSLPVATIIHRDPNVLGDIISPFHLGPSPASFIFPRTRIYKNFFP